MTDYLGQISIQLTRAIVPVVIVVGVFGNSMNIIILTRSSLYNYACSRYFLSLSISSLAYSSINLSYRLSADGYQSDPTKYSTLSCKLITYISQLCIPMAPYFIVLASIDRYSTSSSNIRIRTLSSTRLSRWAILSVIIFFVILYINTPIIVDLRPEDGLGCRNRGDNVYKQVYAIVQCVLFAIIAPILMIIFGVLTIYNTKRVIDGRILASRNRRTERQLLLMLLLQVGTHIVLTLPVCVIYPMLVLPTGYKPTRSIYFAYSISNILWHLSYASAFPLYFLSGRIYQREFMILMRKLLPICFANQILPIQNTLNKSGSLQMTMKTRAKTSKHHQNTLPYNPQEHTLEL